MKQETLEEASERLYPIHIKSIIDKYDDNIINVIGEEDINEDNRECFIEGAKWQQKRSYSEEEVLKLILTSSKLPFTNDEERIQWFEQFKKK